MESVPLEDLSEPKEPSFYLFKHKDLTGLQLPLKGSQRVKYTSLNVSINYIALGTNAGGIHIFRRSSLRHYRFLNAKVFPRPESSRIVEIAVTTVKFSSHENFLAAALSSGNVAVWTLNFDKRDAPQITKKSDEHKGSTVTDLCWNSSSTKLFIGDNKGCVTGLEVSTGKIRNVHTIIKEGPPIVQLDFADERLLVSSTKRCVFYQPSKEDLVQIGTKARDGLYGACFVQRQGNDLAVTYCARPGARLWEVDSSGQVLSTQQYKKLLATPSSLIVGNLDGFGKSVVEKPPMYNFPKLLVLRDHFLLTWTKSTIIIVDPVMGILVLWNNQFDDIEDVSCHRQEIYIFHTGGTVTRYSLIPPKECAAKLFVLGDWLQCSNVLISCKYQVIPLSARDYIPVYVVRRVKEMLEDNPQHEEIVSKLKEIQSQLEGASDDPVRSDEDNEISQQLLVGASDSQSVTSDLVSNPDSESLLSVAGGPSVEDIEEPNQPDKKDKSNRLKNIFQGQLKDLSFDSVLLAGAKAAGSLNWTNAVVFSPGARSNLYENSWQTKPAGYSVSPPSPPGKPGVEELRNLTGSPISISHDESVESWEDGDSDSEGRKDAVVFKGKKKKKKKIHTVDIVSPLQPTDLIKMEKTRAIIRDDMDPTKIGDNKTSNPTEREDDESSSAAESGSGVINVTHESKESLRSRSVAAKQEVVQKAKKLFKRLTPDEKDLGSDVPTAHASKTGGSKGGSTCIHTPLEVKSLTILSRETKKKVRDGKILHEPKVLRCTLLDWIPFLEKANLAVDRVYPKNRDTREYYVTDVGKVLAPAIKADLTRFLDTQDTATVANLATMCFKMKIFSSKEQSEAENDPESAVADFVDEPFLKCETCERKPNVGLLNSVFLKGKKDTPSHSELHQDLEKTRFIGINFQHLDYLSLKASVIANCLDHSNLLKTLLSCLDDFTERDAVDDAIDIGDTKVALQMMRDKAENYQKRLLRHVFRLYYLVPRDVARLCAEIYPYFHPWEVVLVCFSSSANLFSNCSDFLIYVTHLIQRHAKHRKNSLDILDEIYHDKNFLILVFHSALILDDLADSDVRCQCGWPRPGSHQTSFQYEELMIEIVDRFRMCYGKESLEELLRISWSHGYWQGCVQLLVMLKLRAEALQLVLQLGDITLINVKQIWGSLPQTVAEWKYALEFLAKFKLNRGSPTLEDYRLVSNGKVKKGDELGQDDSRKSLLGDALKTNNGVIKNGTTESEEPEKLKYSEEKGFSHNTLQESFFDVTNGIKEQSEIQENQRFEDEYHSCSGGKKDFITDVINQHTCIKNAITDQRSHGIDIKAFSLVLLQKVGSKKTLEIISDARLNNMFFSHEFYYKCILGSLLENHQSALCHRILREVNEHMWSSKCTAMSPQIYQMKQVEITHGSKEDLFKGSEPLKYCRSLEDGGKVKTILAAKTVKDIQR